MRDLLLVSWFFSFFFFLSPPFIFPSLLFLPHLVSFALLPLFFFFFFFSLFGWGLCFRNEKESRVANRSPFCGRFRLGSFGCGLSYFHGDSAP